MYNVVVGWVHSVAVATPPVMIKRGIFAVHKPTGVTSAAVVGRIRKLLSEARDEGGSSEWQARAAQRSRKRDRRPWLKVGHGGTLDKFAEGVLVIGVGEDCKKLDGFLHNVEKSYSAVGELGRTTDTLETEGAVVDTQPYKHIQKSDLERAISKFRGKISQVPPLYSAIKRDGKRLSDLARASLPDQPPPAPPPAREVIVSAIKLTDFTSPFFSISLTCSSGTYVRSLVRDIALELRTVAHTVALCRTSQGALCEGDALREDKWTTEEIGKAIDRIEILLQSKTEASAL